MCVSSPLLSGLLPVCKLSAMYREANGRREDAWATFLSGLQGMVPATGLLFQYVQPGWLYLSLEHM